MAIPLAAKLGGSSILVASVPSSYVIVNKYFAFDEIEKAVLEENVKLTTAVEDSGVKITATTNIKVPNSAEASKVYTWECKVTADGIETGDNSKLKSYLDEKLPTSSDLTTDPKKDKKSENKYKLVWECSNNREGIVSDVYKTNLKITVTKNGEEISDTSLFGPKETTASVTT